MRRRRCRTISSPDCPRSLPAQTAALTAALPRPPTLRRPPTFDCLGLVPFNVSPHYHAPENKAKLAEMGLYVGMEETREQRIAQYFEERDAGGHPLPVLGLREGGLLEVVRTLCRNSRWATSRWFLIAPPLRPCVQVGNKAVLKGLRGGRVYSPLEGTPSDFASGDDISRAVGLKG